MDVIPVEVEAVLRSAALVPSVRPDELDDLSASAVQELLRQGESANTVASYASALRYWSAWYALRYGSPITLPLPVSCVMQFVVDHLEREAENRCGWELPALIDEQLVAGGHKTKVGPLALNTVLHRVAVIGKLHVLRGIENPRTSPALSELLKMARRGHAKRGIVAKQKDALTRDPLEALLATCDDTLKGKRDRALLLFAWSSGGRRRSEVVFATIENTKKVGTEEWVFDLSYSKTNQSGQVHADNFKPVAGAAARALESWLAASGIESGALFRRIRKGTTVGEQLSPAAVRRIVMDRCVLAGIPGAFSAHSLRSGFVTEAGRQQIPLGDAMAMSGHRSVATAMRYFRSGGIHAQTAAHLFEGVSIRKVR